MTSHDFKAMELYDQINILHQNNRNGRYNDRIQELKAELEKELATISKQAERKNDK